MTKIPLQLQNEALQHLSLSTLKDQRERGDLIETYKILYGKYVEVLNTPNALFQRSTQPNLRGHICSTLIRKTLISNCVVYKWNALKDYYILYYY